MLIILRIFVLNLPGIFRFSWDFQTLIEKEIKNVLQSIRAVQKFEHIYINFISHSGVSRKIRFKINNVFRSELKFIYFQLQRSNLVLFQLKLENFELIN